jgi:hypothetical protein
MLASIEAPLSTPAPAPAAPAGLTAIPVSTNAINLAWLPVAGTGITYNVYFGTSSAGVSTLLASGLTSTSYPAANLNCCTLYFFTVKAVSQGIASAASNPVAATTRTPPPPAAPAGLVAVASSSTEITLSWIASTTAGVTYSVFSGTSAGLITNVVAAGLTSAGLSVGGLVPATTYFFQVKANQQTVSSSASNPASATTPRLQAAPCHVTYSKPGDWGNGFLGAIAITNTGSTAIRSWTLTWSWTGNQQVTQSWNGAYTQSGRAVSLSSESWNGSIAPGATITGIGFQGTYTGTNAAPATVYLNGNACH